MIQTTYELPFICEVPIRNPWDGAHTVEVWVEGVEALAAETLETLHDYVFSFWALASGGALAGDVVPPDQSTCEKPTFSLHEGKGCFRFEPSKLAERATHCLVSLLLSAHDTVPLSAVRIQANGIESAVIELDADLDNPYPDMPSHTSFISGIDDAESETQVLHIVWSKPLSDKQRETAENELRAFVVAIVAGAFGNAPIPPELCDCAPDDDIEWHGSSEMTWGLEDCACHWAAFDCFLTLCVSLSERLVPIAEVTIEEG